MECLHLPELTYSEFGQRLRTKIAGRRWPIFGSVELTFRCNLRCVHCYVADAAPRRPPQAELSVSEFERIFGEVAGAGCLWMLLTGGEPLVRRDWQAIYLAAKRQGLLITLFTNGTLLTPRQADFLAEWRPLLVEITLYGRTQATYERITGIPGSHARCLRGIELLLERGIPLKLKTMVMTLNRHELGEMKSYAESLGVDFRFDAMLNAAIGGDHTPLGYRIPPEEVVQLDLAEDRRVQEWRALYTRSHQVSSASPYLYNCGAAVNSFHIDPYGQLYACMLARRRGYNLREGTFAAGWSDFLLGERSLPASKDTPCRHCELLSLCGQCPAWADLEHGDPQEPVPYLCQTAHRRAKAFGLPEAPSAERCL